MTSPTGIIKTDLSGCERTICIELADQARVDCNHMRMHISQKTAGICRATLDQSRHVTISATNTIGNMSRVVLELGFPEVAILTEQASGLLTSQP